MEIIIYLIIFIQSIFIIYLIYKTRKSENFSSPAIKADIISAVNDKYKIDMDAMRNLAGISKKIMSDNDTLTLPANVTTAKQLAVTSDLKVSGNLEVSGNVKFTNKNSNIMEIYPAYTIMMWLGNVDPKVDNGKLHPVPKGWCICDGGWYRLNEDGVAVPGVPYQDKGTPDLRGRFLVGAGSGALGNNDGTNPRLKYKSLWSTGGAETHTMTIDEMPSHNHYVGHVCGGNCPGGDNTAFTGSFGPGVSPPQSKNNTGGNQPHNNMPPWYAINYIMKL